MEMIQSSIQEDCKYLFCFGFPTRNGSGLHRFGQTGFVASGERWGDCPEHVYGPKKTPYNRFVRWAERDIWEDIFSALAGAEDAPDRLFIDSNCIKVHRTAGGAKRGGLANGIGQTRGGRNTRLHAICDIRGRPCILLLARGNAHDMRVAKHCIAAKPPSVELVGDKRYQSHDLPA